MNIRNGKYAQKRAISPIIATVLIIAVTLIAAVAIGGFVFGIFGSASSTANIQVTGATTPAGSFVTTGTSGATTTYACTSSVPVATTPAAAYIVLTNTGTASASVTGITVTWAGASNVFTPSGTCAVGAAGSATATTYASLGNKGTLTLAAVTGQTYSVTVTLSNGASVLYTGTFQ